MLAAWQMGEWLCDGYSGYETIFYGFGVQLQAIPLPVPSPTNMMAGVVDFAVRFADFARFFAVLRILLLSPLSAFLTSCFVKSRTIERGQFAA